MTTGGCRVFARSGADAARGENDVAEGGGGGDVLRRRAAGLQRAQLDALARIKVQRAYLKPQRARDAPATRSRRNEAARAPRRRRQGVTWSDTNRA